MLTDGILPPSGRGSAHGDQTPEPVSMSPSSSSVISTAPCSSFSCSPHSVVSLSSAASSAPGKVHHVVQSRRKSDKSIGAGEAQSLASCHPLSPAGGGAGGPSTIPVASPSGSQGGHGPSGQGATVPPSPGGGGTSHHGAMGGSGRRQESNKAVAVGSGNNVQCHSHLRFLSHLPPYDRSVIPMCSFTAEGVPILKRQQKGRRQKCVNKRDEQVSLQTRVVMDFQQDQVHPAVIRIGLQMGKRRVTGTNARTVAMLTAFERFIEDYCPPPYEAIDKHLKIALDRQINFITHCRPHSLSMGGAIRWLKKRLSSYATMPLQETKVSLCSEISTFISQRILAATCAVADVFQEQLAEDGDCLLVYGKSTAVVRAVLQAKQRGRRFTVVVVDSHPHLVGQGTARLFAAAGIEVTYTLINGLSYHMEDVTKVVLGAAAVLANAAVVNRAGAALVAMVGKRYAKPIFVLCESYKLFDRIVFDSCSFNELDDPELVWTTPASYSSSARERKAGGSDSRFADSTRQYPRLSLLMPTSPPLPGYPLIRAPCASESRRSHVSGGPSATSTGVCAESPVTSQLSSSTLANGPVSRQQNGQAEYSSGHAGGKPDGQHIAPTPCGSSQPCVASPCGGDEESELRSSSRSKMSRGGGAESVHPVTGRQAEGGNLPASEVCVMNLCYDVTPAQFVDFVVIEDGVYPASNVPALVRGAGRVGGVAGD
uniref:Translation initiation factor eIF2B subunit delta n=1 Tax=Toxoplasma gondii TgCATBr9 TaxID=943120 RepID=A0A2T6IDB9_TOXGO|nr:initiation factor, subunit 2 family protein [Toxoplasma gondii TgCATBr9]